MAGFAMQWNLFEQDGRRKSWLRTIWRRIVGKKCKLLRKMWVSLSELPGYDNGDAKVWLTRYSPLRG